LVVFGLVGGLLGFLVRVGLPSGALWLVPCGLAVLSAPWGYLAEELRRPYIYLIPDASWKRLVAASLVTAADLFLSYTVLMVVAMLLAWPGLSRLLAGLLALLAASWLVPCGLAVLSAPWGYLAEELRRPYIYLIPDASWKRLVAASLVTAADLFLSYTVLMVVAMLLAWPGLSRLLAGLLALLAASWL